MSTQSGSINALRRLDYAIVRDGFTAVVGVDNPTEPGSPLPELLSQAYNTISVGRSDGLHGYGLTFLDGSGRVKPELVAPEVSSSRRTARVSSAAALLDRRSRQRGRRETADGQSDVDGRCDEG